MYYLSVWHDLYMTHCWFY